MNPDLPLAVVTTLASFALKTTLAFAVCLALSWLAASPSKSFLVWLSFLYCTAAYWVWLATDVLAGGQLSPGTSPAVARTATSTVRALQIPGSWGSPLSLGLRMLGIAYVVVLSYMLVSQAKKARQLRWVLGFTSQPPDEIAEVFHQLAESIHVRRSRLLVLSGVTSPATFGWIRPTIVLPDVCLEQDRSELEDILRHELHHVRRWDFVWNGFAVVSRSLLFFHPAAWFAVRKMQFDRELACDFAAVLDSPNGRARYAECLIHFARLNLEQDSRSWDIDFAASSNHLKARVHTILAGTKRSSAWLVWTRVVCGLALLAGFLDIEPSLGVLLSYAQQKTSQPVTAESPAGSAERLVPVKVSRRGRLSTSSVSALPYRADASSSQAGGPQPPDPAAERTTTSPSSIETGATPRLVHRSSAASGTATKQQTVVLIDPDASGQVSKSGKQDRSQALQQAATAAADIYKRLAVVDRH